jgi:NusA-like KH domain protein
MQDMRYLNLFEKITGVQTRFCFVYNGIIIFSVPKHLVSKAVGEQGRNVKRMYDILGKKIKIIQHPEGDYGIRQFIAAIVSPFTFKSLEIKENEIILTAGSQSKAALIGRNKRRLIEMQKIIKNLFGKEFKIV